MSLFRTGARLALLCLASAAPFAAWPLGTGDRAPACSARTLADGAPLRPVDYRGQVLYEQKHDYAGAVQSWEQFMSLAPKGEDRDRASEG